MEEETQDYTRQKEVSSLSRIWDVITRERTPHGDPCVSVPGRVVRKPDPCIYSQFLLMKLDRPVTWDNPDVRILKDGEEQDTYSLEAGTEYTIEIDVHNSSRDKPANGTTVSVRWIEFGAGGQTRHPIDSLRANVPTWPGTDTASTTWRTPETPGHYCIEVELSHPEDSDPSNNRGWNNTQVHASNSPVSRTITIFNQYPEGCPPVKEGGGPRVRPKRSFYGWGVLGAIFGATMYRLAPEALDTTPSILLGGLVGYVLLVVLGLLGETATSWLLRRRMERERRQFRDEETSCHLVEIDVDSYEFEDDVGKDFRPEKEFEGKAPTWNARVEPDTFVFGEREASRDVELIVDAPDESGPSGVFNVNVRQGGIPIGGVTIEITR